MIDTVVLALPSNACLAVAVRLVDWHKDFVGIVLTKSRKIYRQAMYVRHCQFDVVKLTHFLKCGLSRRVKRVLHRLAVMSHKDPELCFADARAQSFERDIC